MLPLLLALLAAAETRTLPPGAASPPATIADVAWLAGTWTGPGIGGGPATESYTAPAGGQMSGHFEQAKAGGGVAFYELLQIAPVGRSLVYRLKHFGPDLAGWEDKAAAAAETFPLVAIERDAIHFDGLSFYRRGPDRLRAVVLVEEEGRAPHELAFDYRRVTGD